MKKVTKYQLAGSESVETIASCIVADRVAQSVSAIPVGPAGRIVSLESC